MFSRLHENSVIRLLAMLLAALVALTGALLFLLGPWGQDIWTHLYRAEEIATNLGHGQWETIYSDLKSADRPLPVYVYYSQWIYWLPALFAAAGMTVFAALKISILLLHVTALAGCWLLLRRHVAVLPALLGTLLFASSNYVIGEVFVRGAFSELFSYSLLPLALYLAGGAATGRRNMIALLVAVLAGMILAHPLSFMNSAPLLFLYYLFCTPPGRPVLRKAATLAAIMVTALLMTVFFWGPSLLEKHYVLGPAGLPINVFSSFQGLRAWLNPLEYRVPGLLITGAGLAGMAVALRQLARTGIARNQVLAGVLSGTALYALLILPLSAPLWQLLGMLQANIFVWRLAYPLNLSLALLLALLAQPLPDLQRRTGLFHALAAALALAAVANAALFMLAKSYRHLEPDPAAVQHGIEAMRAPYRASSDPWGVREYLPDPAATPAPPPGCATARPLAATPSGDGLDFTVSPEDGHACLQLPWYWNVRYEASVNGTGVELYADASGRLLLVPDGNTGTGRVQTRRPAYVTALRYLSLATLLALLGWWGLVTAGIRKQQLHA